MRVIVDEAFRSYLIRVFLQCHLYTVHLTPLQSFFYALLLLAQLVFTNRRLQIPASRNMNDPN